MGILNIYALPTVRKGRIDTETRPVKTDAWYSNMHGIEFDVKEKNMTSYKVTSGEHTGKVISASNLRVKI